MDGMTLEPGTLVRCSKCHRWHAVYEEEAATGSAIGMMFWRCDKSRFFAGQRGKPSRHPLKRPRVQLS